MLISRSAGACLLALFTGPVTAQEERDPEPSAEPGVYARIATPQLDLRVFPTQNSPVYSDSMVQGAGVRVGESYGDFRQVVLPLGPAGWVHKKFATGPKRGKVATVGANVSFRYRPQSGEAPVELLPEGKELHVVGEQGDWWQVRLPGGQAWAAVGELQVFDTPSPTLIASYAELEEQQRKVIDELEQARMRAEAEAQFLAELQQRLDLLRERFAEQAATAVEERDYEALDADLSTLIAEIPDGSVVLANARLLAAQIGTAQRVVEATLVLRAEPVPAALPPEIVAPKTVPDPLARFDAVGWLRYRSSSTGSDRFAVEKGGQTLYWVTCSSERYDLTLFDGVEVGLVGGKDRPSRESMRVVDVDKLEILGLPR